MEDPRIVSLPAELAEGEPMAFLEGEGEGEFTIAPLQVDDLPTVVKVAIKADHLMFFPQRSSGQKRVLNLLGAAAE